MNSTEFLKSLTEEQRAAFIALRDEIHAGNATQNLELVKAKADEIAGLKQQLADKDTAHEATIARLKAEHEAALEKATQDIIDKNKPEIERANEFLTKFQEDNAALAKERDDLAAQISALKDEQIAQVQDLATRVKAAQEAIVGIVPSLEEFARPAKEKAVAARKQRIAELEAQLAAAKGE